MKHLVVLLLLAFSPLSLAGPRLAVAPLENHTGEESMAGAGHGVAAVLTGKFARIEAVDVVERERLSELLAEIELGSTGMVDPESAVEAGKVLNADYMIFGSIVSAKLPGIRVTLRVIDVETAALITSAEVTGEVGERGEEFFVLIDELAFAILDAIEIRLAARDRIAFGEVDVRELSTVDIYGRALEALEDGKAGDAKQLLSRAVTLEPEFKLAEAELTRLAEEVSARKSAWAHEAITTTRERWETLDARIAPSLDVADPGPEHFLQRALVARRAEMAGDFERYVELEEKRIADTTAWILANNTEGVVPGQWARDFRPENQFHNARRDLLKEVGLYDQRSRQFGHLKFLPWEIQHQIAETIYALGEPEQALALAIENYQDPGPRKHPSDWPGHPLSLSKSWGLWQAHAAFAQQKVLQAELGGDRDELIKANKALSEALRGVESHDEDLDEYEEVIRELSSAPTDVRSLERLVRREEHAVSGRMLFGSGHALQGYRAFLARVDAGVYEPLRTSETSSHRRQFKEVAEKWRGVADRTFRHARFIDIRMQHLLTYQELVPPEDEEQQERAKRQLEDFITSGYRL